MFLLHLQYDKSVSSLIFSASLSRLAKYISEALSSTYVETAQMYETEIVYICLTGHN